MANRFLNNITINDEYTLPSSDGTNGQVMTTDGAGNITFADPTGGDATSALALNVTVKNIHGSTLAKGTVVHAAPSANPPSGNVIEVVAADANVASNMPALGVLSSAILDEGEGTAVMFGQLSGIDTSSFSIGDELYVSETAGEFTATKPTAYTSQVQKIAVVIKSHASNGLIKVFGAGRSNDVPNRVDRNLNFTDSSLLSFGDGVDFYQYHDGTNSYIKNYTGNLIIEQNNDDKDIIFKSDNGSGGTTEYMRLDGSDRAIYVSAALGMYFSDGTAARFGDSGDLMIYHDNSNSIIKDGGTGNLWIQGSTQVNIGGVNGEIGIQYVENANVTLRHNNVAKLSTTSTGIDVTGDGVFSGEVTTDKIKSATYTSNSFLDFDDDNGVGSVLNTTTLSSIGHMNFIIDSNNNGSIDKFHFLKGSTSPSSATSLLSIDLDGDAAFSGNITLPDNIFVGQSNSTDNYVKVFHSDNKYTEIHGFGITTDRGAYYLRPVNDGTQTLYIGGADAGLDWISIQAKFTSDVDFVQNGTNRLTINSSGINVTGGVTLSGAIDQNGGNNTFTGNLYVDNAAPILRLTETGVTNTPSWWVVGDGGNFSIRLNNTGNYPMTIITNGTNDAVSSIQFKYDLDINADVDINGTIYAASGSASSPSYSFSADNDNGIYLEDYDAANNKDQVSISTDGTRRFRANEAGVWSDQNIYVAGQFRKLVDGWWEGTHGVSGRGFRFRNTTDGTTPLTIESNGNVTVAGNLIIQGDTTTLNTQTVEVEDNILQLNTTQGSPDTATATTSGISIYRGNGITQASFIFDDADDTWDLTNNLAVDGALIPDKIELFDINGTVSSRFQIYAWDNQLQFTKRNLSTGVWDGTLLALDYSDNSATFAGDIIIDNSSGDPFLKLKTSAQEYVIRTDQSDSEKFQIRDTTNSATRLTIDTSGRVTIGTTSSNGSRFHVHQSTNLGGTSGDTLLLRSLQNTGGSGGNNVYVQEWAKRDATGTNWTTWRYHNAIYIDNSYQTPGTDTRTFWERDPHSIQQYFGSGSDIAFQINGGADVRAKLIYDYDNTGYYLNPSSTTNLNTVKAVSVSIEAGSPILTLKDTTDDDDQKIQFMDNGGTVDYVIQTQDPTTGGGGDGLYIGSTNTNEVAFVTNNTTRLTIAGSGGFTFADNIEMSGNSIFTQFIKSNSSVRIDIDNDNNQTDRLFIVSKHNSGTELFRINEDGDGTFTGDGQFAGAIRITETGTSQNILIGNQDSGGVNKPAMINGVNGHIRIGYGNNWTRGQEGGTFTSQMTFNADGAEIIGSSSSNNAFSVTRGDGGGGAFRVQNTGEVVTNSNYLYAAYNSGVSLYVQNSAVFRNTLYNDGTAGIVIADDLTVNDTLFVSEFIRHTGDTGTHIQMLSNQMILRNNSGKYINIHSNNNIYYEANEHIFYNGITSQGHIVPSVDSTYNLGSSSLQWANVYADTATFSGDSAAASSPLIIGGSGSTSYTLQQWQTSAHGTNEAYIIAYGAGHSSQAGNFAIKNVESGGEIFFELASSVEPLRMTSTVSKFSTHVYPNTTNTYQLGSGSLYWSNLYVQNGYIGVMYDRNDTSYYLDPNNTGTSLKVAGNIEHKGLTMTDGTDIDQVKEFAMTFQLTANTWTDTNIDSSDLATGTYAMQVYVSDFNVGGGHYYEYYSAMISWYGSNTNSSVVDEIIVHRAGHAPNAGDVQFRTQRHASGVLMLQVKHNQSYSAALDNSNGGKIMRFKFRRLI